jgi:hypothetical protein
MAAQRGALAERSAWERRRGNVARADALEEQARALDAAAAAWALERVSGAGMP